MNEVEIFFKEFIESKKFSKLKSVNHISTSVFSITSELPQIINFLQQFYKYDRALIMVDTNVTMMNKKSEYILNQQYTLNIGEVLNYYDLWCRDRKIQNILD